MDILITIPAVAEKTNVPVKIIGMNIDFAAKNVSFFTNGVHQEPIEVSFANVIPGITTLQKNNFILVVRTALAQALKIDISKIPADIFT